MLLINISAIQVKMNVALYHYSIETLYLEIKYKVSFE